MTGRCWKITRLRFLTQEVIQKRKGERRREKKQRRSKNRKRTIGLTRRTISCEFQTSLGVERHYSLLGGIINQMVGRCNVFFQGVYWDDSLLDVSRKVDRIVKSCEIDVPSLLSALLMIKVARHCSSCVNCLLQRRSTQAVHQVATTRQRTLLLPAVPSMPRLDSSVRIRLSHTWAIQGVEHSVPHTGTRGMKTSIIAEVWLPAIVQGQ